MNHPYIEADEKICGAPVITGTTTRVVDIAVEYEHLNHTPDKIINAHPTSNQSRSTTPYPTTTRTERN